MITVLKPNTTKEQRDHLVEWFKEKGLGVNVSQGENYTVLGLIGDTSKIDISLIESLSIVQSVKRVSEPYKKCSRKFHPQDTIVKIGDITIGGGGFAVIAGPCSVESEEQIVDIAEKVKRSGAKLLRGGAFKPRTSPYSFQGLGVKGLELLLKAKEKTHLPIVTEIMNPDMLPYFKDVDVLQVGARNMQNYDLLKELGKTDKVILLKRGFSSTITELLMSAEYILSEGNTNVILCERGIRTFETSTRNTLDISAVPLLHETTHLPVIVDPSHATGQARLVPSMSMAATASEADGLIIEVHNDPPHALSDGAQSLLPEQFDTLMKKISKIREAMRS